MQPEPLIHYEIEILQDTLSQPLCENNEGVDAFARTGFVEMSTDPDDVTCTKCLHYLEHGPPTDD